MTILFEIAANQDPWNKQYLRNFDFPNRIFEYDIDNFDLFIEFPCKLGDGDYIDNSVLLKSWRANRLKKEQLDYLAKFDDDLWAVDLTFFKSDDNSDIYQHVLLTLWPS